MPLSASRKLESVWKALGSRSEKPPSNDGAGLMGSLVDAAADSIREHLGIEAELSTSGGTSDGRFIAPSGAQVVELGPVNATIHKLNEEVRIADLPRLTAIYRGVLERLLL